MSTRSQHIPLFLLLLVCLFFNANCRKAETYEPLSIVLRGQPLATIQLHISGRCELRLEKGGICGACTKTYGQGEYVWNFYADGKRLSQTHKNVLVTDTLINWHRTRSVYGDSTYLLNFSDKRGDPNTFVVDQVRNDTLILLDNATDAITHYLVRKE